SGLDDLVRCRTEVGLVGLLDSAASQPGDRLGDRLLVPLDATVAWKIPAVVVAEPFAGLAFRACIPAKLASPPHHDPRGQDLPQPPLQDDPVAKFHLLRGGDLLQAAHEGQAVPQEVLGVVPTLRTSRDLPVPRHAVELPAQDAEQRAATISW